MDKPNYNYGDVVFIAQGEGIVKGTIVGLSFVQQIQKIVYLVQLPLEMPKEVKPDADGKGEDVKLPEVQQPIQCLEETMCKDRTELIMKLKTRWEEQNIKQLAKFDVLLKEKEDA